MCITLTDLHWPVKHLFSKPIEMNSKGGWEAKSSKLPQSQCLQTDDVVSRSDKAAGGVLVLKTWSKWQFGFEENGCWWSKTAKRGKKRRNLSCWCWGLKGVLAELSWVWWVPAHPAGTFRGLHVQETGCWGSASPYVHVFQFWKLITLLQFPRWWRWGQGLHPVKSWCLDRLTHYLLLGFSYENKTERQTPLTHWADPSWDNQAPT